MVQAGHSDMCVRACVRGIRCSLSEDYEEHCRCRLTPCRLVNTDQLFRSALCLQLQEWPSESAGLSVFLQPVLFFFVLSAIFSIFRQSVFLDFFLSAFLHFILSTCLFLLVLYNFFLHYLCCFILVALFRVRNLFFLPFFLPFYFWRLFVCFSTLPKMCPYLISFFFFNLPHTFP